MIRNSQGLAQETIVAVAFDLTDPAQRASYIRVMLERRSVSVSMIADRHKISQSFINAVIRGKARSQDIENAIAETIGVAPTALWSASKARGGSDAS